MTTQTQPRCRDCCVELSPECIRRIGSRIGLCDDCRAKHIAAWNDAHTRHAGDTRPRWLIGDSCRVKLGKVTYDAVIIDMSDTSRADGNYDMVRLRITKTVTGLDGKPYTSTWEHPDPVQSYKLKKPLLRD